MPRVKIAFPAQVPLFRCTIPVRITDINYGNHLGNDSMLSIVHEARMQMLTAWGFSEMNAGGTGLIMADVMIAFKNEAFYGDHLTIDIFCEEITTLSFDLLYKITTQRNTETLDVAHVKTGMICFDYSTRKVTPIKTALREKLIVV